LSTTPTLLRNRYETLAEWTRGAQGRMFLGQDRNTGRSVALKIWDIDSQADRLAYSAEASLVESLKPHRNLPVLVDHFVEGNHCVLVTNWVEGVNLEQLLIDEGDPGLAPSLVIRYLDQIAAALDHVHDHDPPLIHGDVKPANMILAPDGLVVLVDFGAADRFAMQGTAGFVAPELAAGHPKTSSSDIYGLAATAITLITGVVPKDGPVLEGVDPATARAVTRGLRNALAIDPGRRPATARDVVGHLREALEGEHSLAAADDRDPGIAARSSRGRGERAVPVPLPPLLESRGRAGYVGRRDVLEALAQLHAAAVSGGCRVALLAGEPGTGKSRTAAEVARSAFGDGSVVLYGQCGPEAETPYQPFAEALRWQVAHDGGQALGPLAGELVRVLPGLDRYVDDLAAPLVTDPRLEEHRTFDAVAEWLISTSEAGGLVFVIDDLHWATRATLALFEHVLKRVTANDGGARILFLATFRDTDLDEANPLLEVLPSLNRANAQVVRLGGLGESDLRQLLSEMSGHELDDVAKQVVGSLTADSGGNPFFAIEILRNLLETEALRFIGGGWQLEGDIRPPPDVQAALELRFQRLPEGARRTLSAASVIGMEFDVELLSGLVGLTRHEMVDILDVVLGIGLVDETEADVFRFEHALVRSALYEDLAPTERRVGHRIVLGTLQSLGRTNVATLAIHALEAAPNGPELTAAVEYALAAGEEAFEARAFGDAESWSHRVLDIAGSDSTMRPLRIRALCLEGESERDQGNPAFRETLLRAGEEAVAAGLSELAVRSAIANYRGTVSIVGKIDEPRVELLRKAMALEGDPNTRQWALLAATLASDLTFDPSTPHILRLELVDQARASARSTGDQNFLLEVLLRTMPAASVPEHVRELVATGCELVDLADATGDPWMRVLATWATTTTHLAAGEFRLFRRYVEEAEEASRQNCPARLRWLAGVVRPQFVAAFGDLPGARAENDETLALGQLAAEPDALMIWSGVSFGLALLDGTLADLADLAGVTANEFPEFPLWRIAHALTLGAAGRVAEGRDVLDRFQLREVLRIPSDVLTLACWSLLALAAFHLDDRVLAQALEPALLAHTDEWSHSSVWILGPIRWDLGRCYLVQRDWDGAVEALDRAVSQCEEQGFVAHAAVCRSDLVRALVGRDGPSDRDRALEERERGLAAVIELGLDRRVEEFRALAR
jgi:hypothetical protein